MKRKFNAAQVPQFIALESVSVASPCHADWNAMTGDDRSRFCPSCAKNVYNLSSMTRDEAELLLQEKDGRLCVRYFVREDGTMLTQDCPVGVAALKERSPSFALWAGVASLALVAAALISPSLVTGAQAQPEPRRNDAPAQTSTPEPTPAPKVPVVEPRMGDFDIARVTPAATPTATPKVKPTSTPAVPPPLMGKVKLSTIVPPSPPFLLGEVSVTAPTPKATPKPQPTVYPVLGRIVCPPKKQTPKQNK